MADDPINIQVMDNVDPSIASKLNAIADAASKGQANLDQLRASLAAINGNNLATLREQANTVTQSINAELAATNALTQATNTLNTAAASLVSKSKDEAAASAAATRALKDQKDATDALNRSNAAVRPPLQFGGSLAPGSAAGTAGDAAAQTAYQAALARTATAQAAAGASAEAMALKTAGAGAATVAAAEQVGVKAVSGFSKFKTSVASAFDSVKDLVTNNGTAFRSVAPAAEEAGAAIEKVAGHSINTSTALREMLVLVREGGRGDFTRMAGSASILATAIGALPFVLTAAAVGFGALYTARKSFNTDQEQKSLKDYAESLGLTEKEMRKLSNTTVDANGELKEHNVLVVTYGDTINGFIKTVEQGLQGLVSNLGNVPPQIKSIWSSFLDYARAAFVGFSGYTLGVVALLEGTGRNIVLIAVNAFTILSNTFSLTLQGIINTTIDGLNAVGGFINKLSNLAGQGNIVPTLNEIHTGIKGITDGVVALDHVDVGKTVRDGMLKTDATLKGFTQSWKDNTDAAAKNRVAALAAAEIANRNPKKEGDKKTQADYIDDENLKLDNQLKLFGMLKEARDVQTQVDAIQEAFQKRRMPLSDKELQGFKDKIVAIQENNRVQAQMDTIYQNINGPQQKFVDSQTALLELFVRGKIGLADYNAQLVLLTRSFEQSQDPFFKLNEDLKTQTEQLGLAGDALDHYNNSEKVRLALLAQGKEGPTYAKQAADETAKLDANDAKQFVNTQVNNVVNPILNDQKLFKAKKDVYAQIDELQKKGVVTANQAELAKYEYAKSLNNARKDNFRDTLSTIAQLASSHNRVLAGIGKAAAVAQATIDGIAAVQKALQSAPPPFNFVLAGIVGVAAAANVAKIISTPTDTGSYQTGGDFTVNGKSGVDSNRIAMNVSNGERVTIQTVAQQQAAANNNNSTGKGGDIHVANYFDEASFVSAMDSKAGEKVVMNIIGRRSKEVKSAVAS